MPDAALNLMHALILEDGRRWGEVAAHFQLEDARAVLDPAGEPFHYLTRSRGGSKTADLAGLAVASMLAQLPRGSKVYALAADRDQGRLIIESIDGFATRTPELRNALQIDAYKVHARRSGSTLEVLAADAASAWGLRPSFTIVDELSAWGTTDGPRRLFEAVTSAAAKSSTSRMAIITSAGSPSHWSYKVLEHAKADELWRVHEVAGPAPWLDPARLAEQRRRLPESSYARLFENQWTESEDKLTTIDDLAACTVLEGPLPPEPGKHYVLGLDVGVTNDRTVACVCHAEKITSTNGNEMTTGVRVVLDHIRVWSGSRANPVQLAEVGEWVAFVCREYNNALVHFDPHQAIELTQRLAKCKPKITTTQFNFSAPSVGRLALCLYQLLRNRNLALPDDAELLDELGNIRLRETSPGTYRMDHDPDKHDDRAIALALAAYHLVETSPKPAWGVVFWHPPARGSQIAEGGSTELLLGQIMSEREARIKNPGWRDPRYD